MFASKILRANLFYAPFQIGFEYAICFIIAFGFQSSQSDNIFLVAFFFLMALYGFRIVNFLIKILISIPIYYLTRNARIDSIVAMLYKFKLPVTDDLQVGDDTLAEFARIARHQSTNEELRQFLNLTIAEINLFRTSGKILVAMQSMAVIDAAVARYVREFNAARVIS